MKQQPKNRLLKYQRKTKSETNTTVSATTSLEKVSLWYIEPTTVFGHSIGKKSSTKEKNIQPKQNIHTRQV